MVGRPAGNRFLLAGAAVIGVACLVAFWPTFSNDFVLWDDKSYLLENDVVKSGFTLAGIRSAFTNIESANWHPLTWLSHMADVSIFGMDPAGHHGMGLVFHAVNAVLLMMLIARVTGSSAGALAAALLFALHPLRVEAVAWASERKELLSFLFGMSAVLAHVRHLREGRRRKVWLIVSLGCYLLSLTAKQMWVTLPFILLLLDWWPLGRWPGVGGRGETVSALAREKIPYFALAAAGSTTAFVTQQLTGAVASLEIIDFEVRLLTALVAPLRYLGKTLWPAQLSFLYPIPNERYSWWLILASAVFLTAAPVAAFRYRRRWPPLLTGLAWFLGTLVPVSGLVQIGGQSLADRYTYLPHAGLALLAGWLIGGLSGNARRRLAAVLVVLLALMAGRTRWQTSRWGDSETLFRTALEVDPDNWLALNNLGILMDDLGDTTKAEHYLNRALEQRPLSPTVNHNMGMMFVHRGQGEKALVYLSRALAADSRGVKNHEAMGAVLARLGRPAEAVEHYRQALVIKPDDVGLHNNLGVALADLGRFDESIEHFTRAVALKPDYVEGYVNRAGVLAALGIFAAAADDYRAALRLEPGLSEAKQGLAELGGSFGDGP